MMRSPVCQPDASATTMRVEPRSWPLSMADSGWPSVLTPIGVVWETWRGMTGAVALSWLVWIWGTALVLDARGRRRRGIIPPPQSRTS